MRDPVIPQAVVMRAVDVSGIVEARELSLEGLYDQYASALYRFALALVGSSDDAEDAVQEVFVKLARQANRLDRIDNPKRYLFTSTRNSAYGILRSKRRREVLHNAITAEPSADDWPEDLRVERQELLGAFAALPVDQREVLALKVLEEMTFAEIAATLCISANTAASRYRYGIAKLRQALEVTGDGR